jgi:hypothetical protein
MREIQLGEISQLGQLIGFFMPSVGGGAVRRQMLLCELEVRKAA